jgi:hypothetical protein
MAVGGFSNAGVLIAITIMVACLSVLILAMRNHAPRYQSDPC